MRLTSTEAKTRALDREAEEKLRAIRERERIAVELQYKGTWSNPTPSQLALSNLGIRK